MLKALLTRKGHRPFKPRRRFDESIGCPIGFTYYIIYRGAKNIPFFEKIFQVSGKTIPLGTQLIH
jgi:hypothetical protein